MKNIPIVFSAAALVVSLVAISLSLFRSGPGPDLDSYMTLRLERVYPSALVKGLAKISKENGVSYKDYIAENDDEEFIMAANQVYGIDEGPFFSSESISRVVIHLKNDKKIVFGVAGSQ